jgi:hypothetical protein
MFGGGKATNEKMLRLPLWLPFLFSVLPLSSLILSLLRLPSFSSHHPFFSVDYLNENASGVTFFSAARPTFKKAHFKAFRAL